MKKGGKGGKAPPPPKKEFNADDYVTLTLPREEVIEIRRAFEIFDQDGSGIMDPAELKDAFVKLGFTGQNKFVYQIMAELDDDQSGGIDFAEFVRLATAKIGEKDSRAEINKVFTAFDPNRAVILDLIQGKFTVNELKKVAKDLGENLSDEDFDHMFQKADLDDDGFVTAEDFYNIMTHKVYWE